MVSTHKYKQLIQVNVCSVLYKSTKKLSASILTLQVMRGYNLSFIFHQTLSQQQQISARPLLSGISSRSIPSSKSPKLKRI